MASNNSQESDHLQTETSESQADTSGSQQETTQQNSTQDTSESQADTSGSQQETTQQNSTQDTSESQADTSGTKQETTQQNSTQDTSEPAPTEGEYLDILSNGTLLKKIIEEGTGPSGMLGERVTVKWSKEIPEIERAFPEEELSFILGDGDVVQALEFVVTFMHIGEKATIISGYKYMYGELGLEPDIPGKANFKLDVHLISNDGIPDYPTMTLEDRFNIAKKKKDRGNFLFKRGEFGRALNSYTRASKIVDPTLCSYPADESQGFVKEIQQFRAVVLCNTSVVQMRVESYDTAIRSAIEATELWPDNFKAYYRLGQAHEKNGDLDEAIRLHKRALKLDPKNKAIDTDLERLVKLRKESKVSEKQMYARMLGKSTVFLDSTNSTSASVNKEPMPSTSKAPSSSAKDADNSTKEDFAKRVKIRKETMWAKVREMKAHLKTQREEELKAEQELKAHEEVIAAQIQAQKEMEAQEEVMKAHLRAQIIKELKARHASKIREVSEDQIQAKVEARESQIRVQKDAENRAHHVMKITEEENRALQEQQAQQQSMHMQIRDEIEAFGTDEGADVHEAYRSSAVEKTKKFSWLWKTGAAVLGAGLVGIAGIGLYRYMNR